MTEKTLTQRQQKRQAWWKKKNETGENDATENAVGQKKFEPSKKRKLKNFNSSDGTLSSVPNKRKTEDTEPDDNTKGENTQSGQKILKTKKKKKKSSETELSSSDKSAVPDGSHKVKLAKNLKAYVLFVGNLPYHITKEDIEAHFVRTGGVKEVRLLTDKDSGKSRGCAYIDFVDSKSHKFGLRLHESMLGGRKINVEFTSRGRKTPKRTERLKEKNRRMARMKRVFEPSSKSNL